MIPLLRHECVRESTTRGTAEMPHNATAHLSSCGNCAPHKTGSQTLSCREKGECQMGHKQTPPAEWSRRRTRYDPPALNEAVAAAQGLTEQIEGQIAIAAQLM